MDTEVLRVVRDPLDDDDVAATHKEVVGKSIHIEERKFLYVHPRQMIIFSCLYSKLPSVCVYFFVFHFTQVSITHV